ncbi:MAG TPA: glucoamylase family protein, partial [Gemmatimonadales bacterium]|nr:glucoamylase family protein [Gemmatimonadales bacterium]
ADDRLVTATVVGEGAAGAAEWLLDNRHVIHAAQLQLLEGLPATFLRELPRPAEGPAAGLPRAWRLAHLLVHQAGDFLDLGETAVCVEQYQQSGPLTLGELWAFPNLLRAVVLEELATCAAAVAGLPAPAFAGPPSADQPLETRIAGCVTTLRRIAAHDWNIFVERLSMVEAILIRDPADAHARGDFATRDRYRKAVEQVARWAGAAESVVAEEALALCAAQAPGNRRRHIGYWLVDNGRVELEARLGAAPPLGVRLRRYVERHATIWYLGGIALVALGLLGLAVAYLSVSGGTLLQALVLLVAAGIPAVAVAVPVVNWLVTHTFPPRTLARLDFEDQVPDTERTVVAIPTLLTRAADVTDLLLQLEINFQGNGDPAITFALVTDCRDAEQENLPEDTALVDAAVRGINALNRRYGRAGHQPFAFFHRGRRWNPAEACWMGWERKRGKLSELNHLLLRAASGAAASRGDGTDPAALTLRAGSAEALTNIRHVITLDADTALPHDTAARLIGTMAHPLNEPEFDAAGRVIAGYTVLQPRLDVAVRSAGETPFARLFEGDTGVDLYTHAVSDAYHDLFGEGIYAGKGIYQVEAFERSLAGRIPENTLLSHDLFEGIQGRAGFVSDIVLFEDYPSHVLTYTRRLHRWVRGDWQLLPWLLGRAGSTLSTINRWKVADNLRRSLTPPAMVLLLFAGWLVLPGGPWFWTAIAVLTLAVPILLGAATSVNRLAAGGAWRTTVAHAMRAAFLDLLRWLLGLLFLAYEAATVLEAVGRTLHRVFRSRRHLLEWQAAAISARTVAAGDGAAYVWRRMIVSPIVAGAGAVAVAVWAPGSAPAAAPLLLAWFLAPQIGFLLSQPRRRSESRITGEERARLRRLARRTWHYFEQVLGPEDSWLAPDNVQLVPVETVARRTSPTNIGMGLTSTLAAWDLGYLGLRSVTGTLRLSLTGLMSLDRFRGHCYNWYDTRTREVLAPRYVSAVDSGNLAASLLVVRAACLAAPRQRVISGLLWLGLADTVDIFREELHRTRARPVGESWTRLDAAVETIVRELAHAPEAPAAQWRHLQRLRQEQLPELESRLADCMVPSAERLEARHAQELHHWYERIHYQADRVAAEFETLAPWLALAAEPPADITASDVPEALRTVWELLASRLDRLPLLGAMPRFRDDVRVLMAGFAGAARAAPIAARRQEEALAWNDRLTTALEAAVAAATATAAELHDLARDAGTLVDEMDFRFLYDRQRRLFHIGYDVDAARLDSGYYDLLASEARVASLVAIAKRDVPERHWLHLGRPFGRDGVLLSWAGTMFEYLMPGLFLRYPDDSLLTRGSRAAVRHQRRFARRHGIPWGISESSYHQLSPDGHYQYRAFGVPGLGLKRELGDRLVISPYASLLALPLTPHAVADNVARLEKLGAMGRLGLYEAVDFGPPRAGGQAPPALVKSWMSHHQGMILTAIANHFTGSRMVRRFHADPRVASVDYLLYEQVPRHVTIHRPAVRPVRFIAPRRPRYEGWSVPPLSAAPQVHIVSNGRHRVVVTAAGGGGSLWRDYALSRWRAEAGVDEWGHWLYLQDAETDALWSIGRQPVWDAPTDTSVVFTPDGAEFRTRAHGIAARAVLTVPPQDDVEIRRITLTNESASPRTIALTGFFEVALARPADDLRHQAFTKLFVESEILDDRHTLLFRRRPGGPDPEPLWMGHAMVLPSDHAVACSFDTDRAAFLGPGGTARRPAALLSGGPLPGTAGATLDPAAAIRSVIVLDPEEEVTVALVTAAAASREVLLARLTDFGSWSRIDRAFEEATVHAERDLSVQGLTLADVRTAQRLFSVIIVPDARLRPPPHALLGERSAQPGLWRFGISGDLPIVLVRAEGHEPADSVGVEAAVRAHAHLHRRGCRADLVVLDDSSSGYQQPFYERLDQV